MSNVHFNAQGAQTGSIGKLYENLYRPARALFTTPERIEGFVKRSTQKEGQNILQRVLVNPVLKTLGWFGKNASNYDYNKMIPVGKLRVAQAPIGALMMMFLPFTIAPRMVQALKRGEGDKSEFWDILRRDVPTIALLLFALDPLVKQLNKWKSGFDGMNIVEKLPGRVGEDGVAKKAFGEVFSYSKLGQIFSIDTKYDNPKVLYEIARQDNAKGMRNALEKAVKQWQKQPGLGAAKAKEISAFHTALSGMLDELAKGDKADTTLAKKLSAEAFAAMKKVDTYRGKYYRSLSEKELPKLANFLSKHARMRRLPIDILSFALVAVGVGWLPVWFNDLWNKKKFTEQQQAGTQIAGGAGGNMFNNPDFDPVAAFRALKESSRITPPAFNAAPAFNANPFQS